jgi:general secretion pathway protein L
MPRTLIPPALAQAARQAGDLARDGLHWWLGELQALIPGSLKAALGGHAPPIFLRVGTDAVFVTEDSGGELARLPLGAAAPVSDVLRQRAAEAGAIILVLPQTSVLQRVIDLPLSAERELRAAISFEIDRQTPFSPDQVHYRYRIRDRDLARKLLRAELAVVPRMIVEAALAAAQSCGLAVNAVRVEQDELRPPFDFMPRRQILRGGNWLTEPWRPIAAAAALLLLIGTGGIAWHRHAQAQALAAEVAQQRSIGHRAQALRGEIASAEAAAQFLPDKRRSPRAIEIIDTLTQLLPDDSWVFGLELTPQEARIEGFAVNVPSVIERLQQAPLFETPQLRSPVAHSPANSRDRFDLALVLKRSAP